MALYPIDCMTFSEYQQVCFSEKSNTERTNDDRGLLKAIMVLKKMKNKKNQFFRIMISIPAYITDNFIKQV